MPEPKVCTFCGELNHTARLCPWTEAAQNQQPVRDYSGNVYVSDDPNKPFNPVIAKIQRWQDRNER